MLSSFFWIGLYFLAMYHALWVVYILVLTTILALAIELFLGGIGWMLLRLWRAREGRPEQVAIGIGARIGNGLLITVLGWLTLSGAGATARDQLVMVGWLTALFAITVWAAVARPDEVVIGYKG